MLAARFMVIASTIVLKKKETTACKVTRRRMPFDRIDTGGERRRVHGGEERDENRGDDDGDDGVRPVSYTHLTLPTICSV